MAKTTNRRTKGEGSLYYDETKGIYRAMLVTPKGNRMTKSSKDEKVVKDWLNEQRLLMGRGKHIEPHTVTLGDWIVEWLEVYAKNSVRPRTYDRYRSLLDHTEPIQSLRLVQLMPQDFQRLYIGLMLSGTTKKHIHYCLSGCLEQAVKNKLIHDNPIKHVDAPKATTKEIEYFTAEEITAMRNFAEDRPDGLIIFIAINTGMRLSEILALRYEDFDLDNRTVTIKRTVHYSMSAGLTFEEPKNDYSKRTIEIDRELVQRIRKHKLATGTNDALFLTKTGRNESPHNYLRWHYSVAKEATGIKKGFHSFRHTHATMLIEAGIPLPDVSRRLGHSRVSTTLNIYAHAIKANEKLIVAAVDKIFNKKTADPV